MKKLIAILSIMVLGAFALTACSTSTSTSSFGVVGDGSSISITAENADTDQSAESDLTVEEGNVVVLDCGSLTEGKIEAVLTATSGDQNPSISVSAKESATAEVPAGEYKVKINVLEKANGSATLKAQAK